MAIESLTSLVSTASSGASARARPAPAPAQAQTASPAPAAQPAAPPDPDQLRQAAEALNRQLQASAQNLLFSLDESTGKLIVRVVDTATGDVIRQVPSEELLAINRSLYRLQGLLFDQEA
jgi:flagellar protein FlaG